jgi:hypothetical protein
MLTTRAGGAPIAWVNARVPTQPELIELNNTQGNSWTGVWNTPSKGAYQGVTTVRINGQDKARTARTTSKNPSIFCIDVDLVWILMSLSFSSFGITDDLD